jgi:hypothetical protein
MNVQVNLKSAAKSIKDFVKAHGGSAKHSEALELVAKICGFNSYRAMKAVAEQPEYAGPLIGQIRNTFGQYDNEGRTLEDPKQVVYRAKTVDWRLADDPEADFDEVPKNCRTQYDFIVEQYGHQFRVMMKPEGVGLDTFEGSAILDMMLEINNGVPCAHLTNDPSDAMLVTVFGTGQGIIVRPDDGEWMRADRDAVPDSLRELAIEVCGGEMKLDESFTSLHDTAKKYRDDESAEPQLQGNKPQLPQARMDIVHPVRRQDVGSFVQVSFDPLIDEEKKHLWLDFDLLDKDNCLGDDDHFGCLSGYPIQGPYDAPLQLANALSQLIAFFVEAGYSMRQLSSMMTDIVEADHPHEFAKELLDLAFAAVDKHSAYKQVLLKIAS